MLGKNFNLLFYLKKPKNYTDGPRPIYMRITVDGIAKEIATARVCDPKLWIPHLECSTGKSESQKELNEHLSILKLKVFDARRVLLENDREITAESIRNMLTGREDKGRMILEIFQQHNEQMAALVGKDFAPGTMERYKTSLEHTRTFIKWKFGTEDLPISKLSFEFATDYEFWLKTVRKCAHNTSIKYVANFKKIVNHCVRNGWLTRDPFLGYKMIKKEVDVNPLTKEELQVLREKQFASVRMDQVRDIFLFCCYTGLAYADIHKLKRSEIIIGVDGGKWIFTSRLKTDSASRIPLLPEALRIMEKYNTHPQCVERDRVLPVSTNQKMNGYLKEIGDICGITKKFTTHIARHTFATTITLGNGVPIETVSKMLGHKNLKTTQHYAKIIDKKVSDDMLALKQKLQAV